jgi:hypothetical protein
MRELLLSVASPQFLSGLGFLLLCAGLLGEVAILVEPLDKHWTHKPLGFAFAAVVLIGVLIGHIGDDEITAKFERRAIRAEEKLADRALSDKQFTEVVRSLEPFAGQEFTIGSYGGEALSLAVRLRAVLEKANWKWFDPEYQILPLAGTVGIQVWARSQGPREAARVFVATLKGKLIDATLLPDQPDNPNDKKIEIIVGSKF